MHCLDFVDPQIGRIDPTPTPQIHQHIGFRRRTGGDPMDSGEIKGSVDDPMGPGNSIVSGDPVVSFHPMHSGGFANDVAGLVGDGNWSRLWQVLLVSVDPTGSLGSSSPHGVRRPRRLRARVDGRMPTRVDPGRRAHRMSLSNRSRTRSTSGQSGPVPSTLRLKP